MYFSCIKTFNHYLIKHIFYDIVYGTVNDGIVYENCNYLVYGKQRKRYNKKKILFNKFI